MSNLVKIEPGLVVLAHPEISATLEECLLLKIKHIIPDKNIILAAEPGRENEDYMLIPVAHIRTVGEEVDIGKAGWLEATGDDTTQSPDSAG